MAVGCNYESFIKYKINVQQAHTSKLYKSLLLKPSLWQIEVGVCESWYF